VITTTRQETGFALRVLAPCGSRKVLAEPLGLALTFNDLAGIDYESDVISRNDKSGGTAWI
jgi:hypothetical protein